ncbi:MAG: hypothetical protein QMB59_00605, partial [Bacteroidales bacterium]
MNDEINEEQQNAAQQNLGDAKVSETKETISETAKSTLDKLADAVKKAAVSVDNAVDAAKEAVSKAADVVDEKIDQVKAEAPGIADEAKEKGQSFIDKVVSASKTASESENV